MTCWEHAESYTLCHAPEHRRDNAAMESINGWIKSELFTDFHLQGENVQEEMEAYIKFFNEERPAYSLGYLTPKQYRETYATV